MDTIILIVTFAFLGYAIKYIDQAYDEHEFSIRSANLVAITAGVLMGTLMAFDSPFSTAFFIAMIISLVLAKKIDNVAFAAGSAIAFGMMGLFMLETEVTFLVIPIALFLFAGFVDEIVDGYAHKHHLGDLAEKFCHYRPFSDFALIGMIAYRHVRLDLPVPVLLLYDRLHAGRKDQLHGHRRRDQAGHTARRQVQAMNGNGAHLAMFDRRSRAHFFRFFSYDTINLNLVDEMRIRHRERYLESYHDSLMLCHRYRG